jgi:alcohol dehydrogenase, propanol-preferring
VGSLTGTAIENETGLEFSASHGVAAMNEVFPFTDAPAAYERMMSGQARFRVVLDMQG